MGDPSAYRYTIVSNSGEYRTDYLSEGEWFIGLYDYDEELHAVGPELRTVAGYSRELDRNVTLRGLTVTVASSEPLQGIDFTLEAAPVDAAPDDGAVTPTRSTEDEAFATSLPWLGLALLGTGSTLLLAVAATMRWGWRRSR